MGELGLAAGRLVSLKLPRGPGGLGYAAGRQTYTNFPLLPGINRGQLPTHTCPDPPAPWGKLEDPRRPPTQPPILIPLLPLLPGVIWGIPATLPSPEIPLFQPGEQGEQGD